MSFTVLFKCLLKCLLVFVRLLRMENALAVVSVKGITSADIEVLAGRHNASEVIGEKGKEAAFRPPRRPGKSVIFKLLGK
jgi:hypothetical protein